MLIDPSRSLLLVIDVQERLAPAMSDSVAVVRNAAILLQAAVEMKVPALLSEQYPKGLGITLPELRRLAREEDIYYKMEFSAAKSPSIEKRLSSESRDQIIVAGIEAHVCVLQTALDLGGSGRSVFVVADAVDSRRAESKAVALDRMRVAGIEVVTTEMVVFEWLRSAAAPAFKALSKLIR